MSGPMLELLVGLGFVVSVVAALVWVFLWLLRLRTIEVRGPRPPDDLSDEELADLLNSEEEESESGDGH